MLLSTSNVLLVAIALNAASTFCAPIPRGWQSHGDLERKSPHGGPNLDSRVPHVLSGRKRSRESTKERRIARENALKAIRYASDILDREFEDDEENPHQIARRDLAPYSAFDLVPAVRSALAELMTGTCACSSAPPSMQPSCPSTNSTTPGSAPLPGQPGAAPTPGQPGYGGTETDGPDSGSSMTDSASTPIPTSPPDGGDSGDDTMSATPSMTDSAIGSSASGNWTGTGSEGDESSGDESESSAGETPSATVSAIGSSASGNSTGSEGGSGQGDESGDPDSGDESASAGDDSDDNSSASANLSGGDSTNTADSSNPSAVSDTSSESADRRRGWKVPQKRVNSARFRLT
ncbi:hypothetical protein C8R46DRAFT_1209383 [Mycena filopes]|nr:hypothetical protein C8R46DRAFT_1209383 [Mycena filopes]